MEQAVSILLKKKSLPYIFTFFFLVAFIVFGNSLFNNFISDDKVYILNNPETLNLNILSSFEPNLFNNSGQYRPIPSFYFSLLYHIFGANPFPYHLLQIFLHITSTFFLFILFRKFLATSLALALSLIFLIHPLQVESVSYIAQTASPLLFLFGILALLLSIQPKISTTKLVIIYSFLLLSLLVKETGFLFLVLIFAHAFLFDQNNIRKLVVGGFVTVIIYVLLRVFVGHVTLGSDIPLAPIGDAPLSQRLITVPLISLYYLKTFFYPKTLLYEQAWTVSSINWHLFYLPLIIDLLFCLIFGIGGYYLVQKQLKISKGYLFFALWFFFGIGLYLQIFPLDWTVADRWFYFPMVGLLGMLGILYKQIAKNIPYSLVLFCVMVMITLLGMKTIQRNNDWKNGITLYTHDIPLNDNFFIENALGTEYAERNQNDKALQHYLKAASLRPYELNLSNAALMFYNLENIQQSNDYFQKALQARNYHLYTPHQHALATYRNYAFLLVIYNKTGLDIHLLQEALRDYPDSSDLWSFLAMAEYKYHNKNQALNAASKAYQLNSNQQDTYIYTQIHHDQPIRTDLGNGKTLIINP